MVCAHHISHLLLDAYRYQALGDMCLEYLNLREFRRNFNTDEHDVELETKSMDDVIQTYQEHRNAKNG